MYHGKVTPLGRRPTGAKIKKTREKKKRELGGYPAETQIGERRVRIKRTKGGGFKLAVLKDGYANISKPDGSTIKSSSFPVLSSTVIFLSNSSTSTAICPTSSRVLVP